MITLTERETKLINLLDSHVRINRETIKRGRHEDGVWVSSEKEFELSFEGERPGFGKSDPPMKFSACLVLSCIRELFNWTKFADMTDYPEMVREGDWSGVRDTSWDKLWRIFNETVLSVYC